MILLLSVVGNVEYGCLLPNVTLARGTFPTGNANPANKQCYMIFSWVAIFPAWVRNFVVGTLNGLERHIPRKIQLQIGILLICFWGPLTQALCAIWFPQVQRRMKAQCNESSSWSDRDGVSFLYIQVAAGATEYGMDFGNSPLLMK